jgi:diguanylate cyclase (GGDEF)-like protein/PAS domain S-box-containing protein
MAGPTPETGERAGRVTPGPARLVLLATVTVAMVLGSVLPWPMAAVPSLVPVVLASVLAAGRSRSESGPMRAPLVLLAAALAVQAAGATIATSLLVAGVGRALAASLVAWSLAASAPLLLTAVLALPLAADRRRRIRAVFDTAVAALAFGLALWPLIVPTGADVRGFSWLPLMLVVVAVVLATSIIWLLAHGGDESGVAAPVVWWWSTGLGLLVAAVIAADATGQAGSDRFGRTLLVLSAGAFAAAVLLDPRPGRDLSPAQVVLRERVATLAPLVPLVLAAASLLTAILRRESLTAASVALTVVLLLAVAASTLLARLDSLDVSLTLEDRVAERTLALGTREKWFSGLIQNSSDVITVVAPDATIRYQTPSGARVLGHDPTLLVGQRLSGILRPDDARRLMAAMKEAAADPGRPIALDLSIWHRDGHWCATETTVTSLLHDPRINGLVLNTRDVSERRRLEEALTRQAYSDGLTGLANRTRFRDGVEGALDSAPAGTVAVVFMDLNGFKAVNDSQGHAVGDHLLTLVGQRLRNCVRPGDVVARLGGDEFAVLVQGDQAEAGAVWVADRVRRVLAGDFVLDGRSVTLAAAIGIAVNDEGDETADQLLRNADLAMYRAKAGQRTEFLRFETSMHEDLLARVDAEKDLRRAVERGDLCLHYQPLVDLRTGDVVGAEALARWNHPERGLVSPTEFIDLAEETGLVERIGAWALHEAAQAAAGWQHFAPADVPFRVSVNVSGRQVGPGLPRTVRDALAASGLSAGALTLEMTESVLMDRPDEAAAILTRLKSLGVRIAIDDFGTGYSSLAYLARFPVDVLKIDRSFVEHVDRDSEPSELVRTIIQLGRSLQLVTVAEGVETERQREAIAAMGCTLGQGYLFSKALPAEAMTAFLGRRLLTHA